MQAINDFFAKYMGLIIGFFCRLCGNHFALAIFLFTLFTVSYTHLRAHET